MSRGRKKSEPMVIEDAPVSVEKTTTEEEPVTDLKEDVVTEEEPVADLKEDVVTEEPAAQTSTNDEGRAETLAWASRYIDEHSRRRGGSVSGMMNTVYRITISGGRVRYFTLPINVEECAVEESWKRCSRYMTPEEFMAFLTRVLGIPPPPFYSVFRVISIE